MQRIKKTFYITLIALVLAVNPAGSLLPVFNIYTKQAYAMVTTISDQQYGYQIIQLYGNDAKVILPGKERNSRANIIWWKDKEIF